MHDPRGTFVSLSHVCPSAADRLDDPALLVLAPLPRAAASFDGLDVRRALPPALSARRLLDWDALSAWETQALDACARNDAPEDRAAGSDGAAGARAALDAGRGSLAAVDGRVDAGRAASPQGRRGRPIRPSTRSSARRCRPASRVPPAVDAHRSRRDWRAAAPLIRRYLAARLIACWPMHYGTGLATAIAYVAALLSVLAVELARRHAPAAGATRPCSPRSRKPIVWSCTSRRPTRWPRGLDAWAARHLDGGL